MVSRYEEFTAMISGIERMIQKIERDEMEKLGYKGAYAQYLVAMRRYPEGLTAAQLCEICDRDKAAVSRVTGELEARGLVIKESGASYRARLNLSEEGQRLAEFISRKAQAAVDAGGYGLTEEERRIYYVALERIARNLEIISRDGIPDERK